MVQRGGHRYVYEARERDAHGMVEVHDVEAESFADLVVDTTTDKPAAES